MLSFFLIFFSLLIILFPKQEDFYLRDLTSPSKIKSLIVFGDFQGYLHALNTSDGEQVARKRVSRSKIISLSTFEDNVLTLDAKGKLSLFTLQ